MTIAMVDRERPENAANEALIRRHMKMLLIGADLVTPEPKDCEQSPLPGAPRMAFVAVNSAGEVQLLRQIAHFNPDTALTIVSRSPEYGMEGIRYGVTHYLLEPIDSDELIRALLDSFPLEEVAEE